MTRSLENGRAPYPTQTNGSLTDTTARQMEGQGGSECGGTTACASSSDNSNGLSCLWFHLPPPLSDGILALIPGNRT